MSDANRATLEAVNAVIESARKDASPQQILDFIPYSSFIGAQAKNGW